jgi:hypothetical protein
VNRKSRESLKKSLKEPLRCQVPQWRRAVTGLRELKWETETMNQEGFGFSFSTISFYVSFDEPAMADTLGGGYRVVF